MNNGFIKKFNFLLTNKDKNSLLFLLLMSLFLSVIETISLASIVPFISMASNHEIINNNEYLFKIYSFLEFKNTEKFIIAFGVFLIIFYVFKAVYTVFFTYRLNKFTFDKYAYLSNILYTKNLLMSYSEFTNENSAKHSKVINHEIYQLSLLIQNTLNFLSEILIIILLYSILIYVDFTMTFILTIILGLKILAIKLTISKKIKQKGIERAELQEKMFKIVNETFNNFKVIKLLVNTNFLKNKFSKINKDFSKVFIANNVFQIIPKNTLETVGISLLIIMVIYVVNNENSQNLIPIISIYALALYRTLPAINRVITAYNNITFLTVSLDIVYNMMKKKNIAEGRDKLEFKESIQMKNIKFGYKDNTLFKDFNLEIKKNQKIAFIGESGSGKSTLIDLLCGVYKPDFGSIYIDEVKLNDCNMISWREKIGYIPQEIYLFDGSVVENITFGREYSEKKMIDVLKQVNILDTLKEKNGLNTLVGEGGVHLSGGQKQRIGIARALYGDPDILVLDEATSALDTNTEKAIMNEIYKVSKNKTLMIIAHRLSTIERCDTKIDVGCLNK